MGSGDIRKPSSAEASLKIDKPAIYRIRVVGFLDEKWSARLGGVDIDSIEKEEKVVISTLSGQMLDQAALFGVLKTLYDMRMPLLSVELMQTS